MAFDLGNILQHYLGGTPDSQAADQHFDQAARSAPTDLVGRGLSEMFRSDATPPFPQMAGQLFGRSDPTQRAGLLNQLLAGIGPAVLASLARDGGGGLGGLLGRSTGGATPPPQLTPEQANTVTPDEVQVIAEHAHQANPGIVDRIGGFYAEHPGLVKTLGSAALTIALAKMAEHRG